MVGACPYPVPQGSQVLLRATAGILRDRGHDVHLVVYAHGIGEDGSGLPIHRGPAIPGVRRTAAGPSPAKPILDAALAATLRRVVREQRIEIVHVHNYEALLVALAARTRPIVYHAHNAMADELPHFFTHQRLAGRFGAWLDGTFPRRADHVIAPHGVLASYLLGCGCLPGKVSVIAPSTDAREFEVARIEDAPPPVLYAGNLDAYQNLGLLTDAMAILRRSVPDARLIVATAAACALPEAEAVATPDFAALKRVLGSDAVCACPRTSWSGYPMKLLNAMAAGLACVACRGAGYPITHEHDGLLVDDNDAAAFAEALARLMDDAPLRRRLGANARATVEGRHDPDAIAAAIEDVYARVRIGRGT